MKKTSLLLVFGALAAFGLVACGSDDDNDTSTAADTSATQTVAGGGSGGAIDISAAADGSLAYDQTEVTATAGKDTLNFDNPASLSHDVVIEDSNGKEVGKTDLISQSSTSSDVELQPGTYTFFCSVPGHREAGMEGTITVK